MSKDDTRSDSEGKEDGEAGNYEETELWEGIQDAKDDNFVRPDTDFEF